MSIKRLSIFYPGFLVALTSLLVLPHADAQTRKGSSVSHHRVSKLRGPSRRQVFVDALGIQSTDHHGFATVVQDPVISATSSFPVDVYLALNEDSSKYFTFQFYRYKLSTNSAGAPSITLTPVALAQTPTRNFYSTGSASRPYDVDEYETQFSSNNTWNSGENRILVVAAYTDPSTQQTYYTVGHMIFLYNAPHLKKAVHRHKK